MSPPIRGGGIIIIIRKWRIGNWENSTAVVSIGHGGGREQRIGPARLTTGRRLLDLSSAGVSHTARFVLTRLSSGRVSRCFPGPVTAAAAAAADAVTAYSINRLTIICAFPSMNYKWRHERHGTRRPRNEDERLVVSRCNTPRWRHCLPQQPHPAAISITSHFLAVGSAPWTDGVVSSSSHVYTRSL